MTENNKEESNSSKNNKEESNSSKNNKEESNSSKNNKEESNSSKNNKEESNSSKNENYDKINENKEKINEKMERGRVFANQAANDLGKGFDDLIMNLKTYQKNIDDKFNEYKKNAKNTLDVDLIEDSEKYYLKVAIPGVKKETIDVEMSEKSVFISCEFKPLEEEIEDLNEDYNVLIKSIPSGKCQKEVPLESEIEIENVKAKYENGSVFVQIPKVETKKSKIDLE